MIDDGKNLLSLLHTQDAADAFVHAVEGLESPHPSTKSGIYHLADDKPSTMEILLKQMANKIGAEEPSSVPKWLAGMALR